MYVYRVFSQSCDSGQDAELGEHFIKISVSVYNLESLKALSEYWVLKQVFV